ncbi:S-adenosyl-L-methionine-dependent methyltransferase [Mycena floridula]|nr:S-adenosyl-L-methionine-dependent methyltransferase [Mycena floridula]
MQVLEFYSGIGGLHLALKRSKANGSVLRAFDWDQTACQVYEANYGSTTVQKTDISTLAASDLDSLDAKLWLLSPACQPYTVLSPNAKGALDPRAQSFLHLIRNVLPSMKRRPSHLLVENVARFETSSTRQLLLSTLRSLGYHAAEFLLTPLLYGIPNSRLRYYLLARDVPFQLPDDDSIPRSIPNHQVPNEIDTVRAYLDDSEATGQYAVPDKVLLKWGRLFDIVLPSSHRTCCFTRGYTKLVERAGSILQMNEDLDTTETFDLFLESQKAGTPDVRILHPLRLRYFSPPELLRILDFRGPKDLSEFIWPANVSTKTKYRLLGNSVNVRVVQDLIDYLVASPGPTS